MKTSRCLLFLSSLLLSLVWTTLANEDLYAQTDNIPSEIGTNHALIIGIKKYDKSAWGDSTGSVKDANTIAKILKNKYNFRSENVTLLTDETQDKPDKATLDKYIFNYVSSLTERDNLLIFYSGHSETDDEGQTYWIPKEATKDFPQTWYSHEALCNYLDSDNFKAKNVIVITDSNFSKKLLRPSKLPPSPSEFQYSKKILLQAKTKSRQVISFGNIRTEPNKKYNDLSLFTYYVHKALNDNWFKVIDFENLIYNKELRQEAGKEAGARIIKGRLKKSANEMTGQAVIACVKKAPEINISNAYVEPKVREAGKEFIFTATTSRPAFEVYVELGGRKYPMEGKGTEWKLKRTIKSIGTFEFTALTVNEDNIEGKKWSGEVEVTAPTEGIVKVVSSDVSPKEGKIGGEYSFTAKTDSPAKKVKVVVSGKSYNMKGSGTNWTLKRKINEYGNIGYSVIALNEKDIEGLPQKGPLLIEAPKIKIVNISTSKGYAGDVFTIKVRTDYAPKSIELNLGGKNYKMQGSGKNWQLKREIPDTGKQSFTVTAINKEDDRGIPGQGNLIAEERPPGIPDIAQVTFTPRKPQAGTDFVIKAITEEVAKEAFIEIDGKKVPMSGSGKEWRFQTKIASMGRAKYEITAINKNGIQGKKREGAIEIIKKEGIDIAQPITVKPSQGNPGDNFTWKVVTAEPATSVTINIEDKDYPMKGSGKNWTYNKIMNNFGSFDISARAKDSKGKEGGARTVSLRIKERIANVRALANTKVPQSPNSYAGEDFIFEVQTDNPAKSVTLDLNGSLFDMKSSGKNWKYTVKVNEVDTNEYSIIAKNRENEPGKALKGTFESKYAVISTTLNPAKVYAGVDFTISATMNAPAKEAFIEIDGKKIEMDGAGTSWDYLTKIATTGSKKIKITAIAKDGKESVPIEAIIPIKAPPVDVLTTKVIPKTEPLVGGTFTFESTTDKDAEKVVLSLLGTDYPMKKSGNEWSTSIEIPSTTKPGNVNYSVAANSGSPLLGSVRIKKPGIIYKQNKNGTLTHRLSAKVVDRYIDHGNGTVTDRYAGLMMLQQHFRMVKKYKDAEDEIRSLNQDNHLGYNNWRLPTEANWKRIYDISQSNPALPPSNLFKAVYINNYFWSMSDGDLNRKKVADLARGKIMQERKTNEFYIWPVRVLAAAELD